MHPVLIESDWNLNLIVILTVLSPFIVLIESDWNLKEVAATYLGMDKGSINRIRLEFKVREEDYSSREDRRY